MSVYDDVQAERVRQDRLCKEGKFPWTCATPNAVVSPSAKLAVLAEEFGEVAKEVNEGIVELELAAYAAEDLEHPPHRKRYRVRFLREELIQGAAVAAWWAQSLEDEV